MKIGIIYYSKTKNTFKVAEKLGQTLTDIGHQVTLEEIVVLAETPKPLIKYAPKINPYEIIIFACPVHAFSLPPIMRLYLSNLENLAEKYLFCFVTQHFKKPWLGGNRTIRQIVEIIKNKGNDVISSNVINWSRKDRDMQIANLLKQFSNILSSDNFHI